MTHVSVRCDKGVALLKLSSEDGRNTLTSTLFDQLRRHIDDVNCNPSVQCLLIYAEGKAFSAGADLNDVFLPLIRRERKLDDADEFTGGTGVVSFDWLKLLQDSKPIITAINGYAVGGGITAFLASDFLFASENASFHFPFAKLGIVPEMGASKTLADRVGLFQAKRLIFTSASVEASEAKTIGLVDEVYPHGQLLDHSLQLAQQIAAQSSHALALSKKLLQQNHRQSQLNQLWKSESAALRQCFQHPHHHEAVAAFLEKRPADFTESNLQNSSPTKESLS